MTDRLRSYVEHDLATGATISVIMARYLVSYEYARKIQHGMRTTATSRQQVNHDPAVSTG